MDKKQHEEMVGRELGELQTYKVVSSEKGKNCDLYNHGSYHSGRKDQDGNIWVDGHVAVVHSFVKVDRMPMPTLLKQCMSCKNDFDQDWPFIYDKNKDDHICSRCYERRYVLARETYRESLRDLLLKELDIDMPDPDAYRAAVKIELQIELDQNKTGN